MPGTAKMRVLIKTFIMTMLFELSFMFETLSVFEKAGKLKQYCNNKWYRIFAATLEDNISLYKKAIFYSFCLL